MSCETKKKKTQLYAKDIVSITSVTQISNGSFPEMHH